MKLYHHITVFFISEREKADFLEAGVQFTQLVRGPRGECATFEIGEDDSRWQSVTALIASLEGNDKVPKNYRVQDISMTTPTFRPALPMPLKDSSWLDGYSGQTVDELIALEGKYRIDSIVLAFEQAIQQKEQRSENEGLTDAERTVVAVEALEREVNNGGYDQFFVNSPEFAPTIVESLRRIGCKKTATITQKAIKALGVSQPTAEEINSAIAAEDERRSTALSRCDDAYYEAAEPVADRLFAFIKANKRSISL